MVDSDSVRTAAVSVTAVIAAVTVARGVGLVAYSGPGATHLSPVAGLALEGALVGGALVGLVVSDVRDATVGTALGAVAGVVVATALYVPLLALAGEPTVGEYLGRLVGDLRDVLAVVVEALIAGVVAAAASWRLNDALAVGPARRAEPAD